MNKKLSTIMTIVLAVALLVSSCGGGSGAENDGDSSNISMANDSQSSMAGKYNIFRFGEGETAVEGDLLIASGMDGNYIELKADYSGVYVMSGTEMAIEWNENGDISTSGVKLYSFTVDGDVLKLDMLGTPVVFVREGSAPPDTLMASGEMNEESQDGLIPVSSAKAFDIYYAWQMGSGGDFTDCLQMGMDPGNTYLQINKDGSGALTISGSETKLDFADGKVSCYGSELYTYTLVGSDEIDLDMMGAVYKFLKEGSQKAVDAGLVDGATGSVKKNVNYRHLMAGESILEVDGGVLYYEVFSNEAKISYGYVEAKNLYIPEEIEGKPVTAIRRLHGNIENLYLPSSLEYIYSSFGDFEGLKTLTFSYDSDDCRLKRITQGCCDYGHFKRDKLEKVVFPKSMASNVDFELGKSAFGEAFNLSSVENIPPAWKEGTESLEKGAAMLKNPSDYIRPQSDKVIKLAAEITKGLKTDDEKVYAICKWVVNNIVYDITGYDKYVAARDSRYYGGDYNESDVTMSKIAKYPDDVIDKKVAVCEGFSRLTQALCNAEGIPAVLVTGVLPPKKDSWELSSWHAWNMVYIDGEWKHIDTTFCNKDYNAQITYTRDGELDETIAKESAITYEDYMNNAELQQNYTWEEIEAINQYTEDTQGFDAKHYYYCLPALAMGADHIAYYVDDMVISGVNPTK
ncbi:MAG: hypothetical protein E7296_01565 [Lachnospiraceae bacterium]|jgi:hypothetical protein|nr:hypothetical protein [Lachnospiraceae bacterium]